MCEGFLSRFVMPRKRKQQAHLDRLNVQRAKKPSLISHDNQHEPLDSSASSSHAVIDSETESDNEIYWPVEDDWDENFFEDGEQKSLLPKWIPNAKPKARKPHIGVSRWTTWRRQSENNKRAESMAGNKTLFDLWNIDRNSQPTSIPVEPVTECENLNDRISEALQILQNSFYIDTPNRQFERVLKTTTKSDFMRSAFTDI
jgi:hypothetical protein